VNAILADPQDEARVKLDWADSTSDKETVASDDSSSDSAVKRQEGLNRAFLKSVVNNDIDAVRFLIRTGANIFTTTEAGSNALHIACERGFIRVTRELLRKDPTLVHTVNNEKATPMHLAALHGLVTLVQILLDNGADINAADVYGATPLHCAAFNDDSLLGRFLLSRGADPNLVDRYNSTALHIAAHVGNKMMITVLVTEGVPLNAQDKGGATALHNASYNGHGHSVRELLMLGADRDVKDNKGRIAQELWCKCAYKPAMACAAMCASSKKQVKTPAS